jgi:hypothetical protein
MRSSRSGPTSIVITPLTPRVGFVAQKV